MPLKESILLARAKPDDELRNTYGETEMYVCSSSRIFNNN